MRQCLFMAISALLLMAPAVLAEDSTPSLQGGEPLSPRKGMIITPGKGIDYKLRIIHPSRDVDYVCTLINPYRNSLPPEESLSHPQGPKRPFRKPFNFKFRVFPEDR